MSSGQLPVTPHHIFGAKRKWKPFKRDKSTSRDFVARSAASPQKKQRQLRGLTYSTLKFTRSTCAKSKQRPECPSLLPHFLLGGPMRAFFVWSWELYEVSLNYLWFRLPLEDRFSNSLLTLIFLPISLHFTTLNIQNNNIKVTYMYDFTGIT